MPPARKTRSASFAVLALGCVLFGRPINFVAQSARRAILSSALLPALLPVGPATAADKPKAAAAPAPPPTPKRIQRASIDGKVKFSFLPPQGKEWELQKDQATDTAFLKRKDGSFITIKQVEKGAVRQKYFARRTGPGNGFKLESFSEGPTEDYLEWRQLATIQKGTDGGGAMPGGFMFNGAWGVNDWTSYVQWMRALHGERGDVFITAAVNADAFKKDEKVFRDTVASLKFD